MKPSNDLHEDILKQLNVGFTKNNIANNLLLKGHSKEEIKEAFDTLHGDQASTLENTGTASATSIWVGIIILVLIILKLASS